MALSIQYLETKLINLNKKLEENKTQLAATTRLAYKNRMNRRIEGLKRTISLCTHKLTEKENQLIQEMSKCLTDRYDCILKIDALKFLRKIYPKASIKLFVKAYNLAYPE